VLGRHRHATTGQTIWELVALLVRTSPGISTLLLLLHELPIVLT
jgi:hypothetical protein